MTTTICKDGHDHSEGDVAIPLRPGRKYHCGLGPRAAKYRDGNWTNGSLADAIGKGIPPCEICFGRQRPDA